jgi:hypothetical protein|tara:strand:+ start:37 stop:597 length:561 start_codon:yes stop_codon:yes gene_type:complete
MAYKDLDATAARGMWSPPNGAAPQIIPDQWKDNPGDALRYDLPDKTDDELVALGWKKVDMPSYAANGATSFIKKYEWNSETRAYDSTDLGDTEKQVIVNYENFWEKFIDSSVYTTIKTAASTTLSANVLYTEFCSFIEDAKRGHANATKLQESITAIIAGITLSADERTELQTLFDSTGMSAVYTL